ncbi:N-acetylmuramoyl-L-alanine amidase [Bifidobacterium oedipodis]|uniref:N-acetylmuramoyl-L-alanine amidase n=1 Tax=Bifidobacterium oedipodis TaxID=2675322 RepID=A0A7Y0HRB5_9BIFI|nr:N-acetylmuramoyl-L-alanine amidase [Bifidobacterium sp. DSM 109957]NMM93855.1 N-acetylmuramoyl-L-alanine amidase [Bifidobacterium sp. DSM 109957]
MTGSAMALWRGSPNHYDGRRGWKVDHITLHIMVGWLWGTDSCFQQASFGAASHYGVGGTQVLQWVDEDNGSWADANWISDCSGITIEHQGGMAGIPMTAETIETSAQLCADISRRYGLGKLYHDGLNGNVYLHREIPGTTHAACPDLAVNGLPYQQIIDRANQILEGTDMAVSNQDLSNIFYAVWGRNAGDNNKQPFGNPYETLKRLANVVPRILRAQDANDSWIFFPSTGRVKALTDAQVEEVKVDYKNMGLGEIPTTAFRTAAQRTIFLNALKED